MTSRCYWLMLLASVAAAVLAGCGGGGHAPQGRTATAMVTIKWPARSRLIPAAANSVKVVAYNLSGFSAPRVLNRPTEGGLSTATFDRLPAGMLYFAADAYPQTDAGGVAQATATASTNAIAGNHLDITMTMASTITQVVVAPDNATVDIDGMLPITATPKNAADEVVLVALGNITFSSASSSVVTVDPSTGVATGVRSASTTITATESDSGLSGSVNVTGAFPPGAFAGEERTNPADGATMVWVPAGNFLMGDDTYAKPKHTVSLDGFWIYKYEVTHEQYAAFCTATARAMAITPPWGWLPNHPIVNVSWEDAKAYAAWSAISLPTEAQWEKASRGTDGRTYTWGEVYNVENYNNQYDANPLGGGYGVYQTASVGSYPADTSPYGAMDMTGNVYEYCKEWYSDTAYYLSPTTNPPGPTSGTQCAMRSSCMTCDVISDARCAHRTWHLPNSPSEVIGFRCAVAARDAVLDNSSVTDGTITIQ